VYLGASALHGAAVPLWAWLVQPGGERDAWVVALVAFGVGAVMYVLRGARAEGARD
jgi:hypothetical protein